MNSEPHAARQWTLWTEMWDLLSRINFTHGYAFVRELDLHGPTTGDLTVSYHYKSEVTGGAFSTLEEGVARAKAAYTDVFGEPPTEPARRFTVTDHRHGTTETFWVRSAGELAERGICGRRSAQAAWEHGHASSAEEHVTEVPSAPPHTLGDL
ncbi:hypothetical protein [Deinococcus soli (ex Cha et al. 2016)]|uniref:Uncharacterized protein n=2 Tax=Deinococcus soli (ex Cha et al. 2016) TaxID=1309411 RepID=A0ACC6KGM8_9DEIO|nr:hypothetical protein [Deinococcus soli (ex Cha et al. 2016)]MDR6219037.1 hypothetical protein [Deinococcus soli (ex Cha et al. 2016)]MDR6328834.1 hypothetical protein [Deinococcus soli (ex Cha et al. 2016)]MDR6751678.1 hypothetical protein [Deinococcus soli (ex Cha et al. 2016)]